MKPYFAKYLPVEGEIKEGDLIIYEGGGSHGKIGRAACYRAGKKVKLFLCSRDIQVGDEYYTIRTDYFAGPHKCEEIDRGAVWHYEGQASIYTEREFAFKKIGEISPDALSYVKEGDEFDKQDINPYAQVWITGVGVGYREYVAIKCPTCKTFH